MHKCLTNVKRNQHVSLTQQADAAIINRGRIFCVGKMGIPRPGWEFETENRVFFYITLKVDVHFN